MSNHNQKPLVIAVSINGEKTKADNPNVPRSHSSVPQYASMGIPRVLTGSRTNTLACVTCGPITPRYLTAARSKY
ncbi:MAG: hypothetical protein ABW049_10330 [Spongiibacteraceae bacterium]